MVIGKTRFLVLGLWCLGMLLGGCQGSGEEANASEKLEQQAIAPVHESLPAPAPELETLVEDTPEVPLPVQLGEKEQGYEKEIQKFEALEAESPSARGGIVFTGSSSIRMWESLAEDMAPLPAINRGFGGSTLRQVNAYAPRIIFPLQPQLVVLYAGENDVAWMDMTGADAHQDFLDLVRLFQYHLPETPIIYISMKPSPSRWKHWPEYDRGNQLIRETCEADGLLSYVDVGPAMMGPNGEPNPAIFIKDMLHMNAQGYAAWTDLIRPVVESRYQALSPD